MLDAFKANRVAVYMMHGSPNLILEIANEVIGGAIGLELWEVMELVKALEAGMAHMKREMH